MQLQDLNPGDLLRYITACRLLIDGYKRRVVPAMHCPLCEVAREANFSLCCLSKCSVCPWMLIDKMACGDYMSAEFTHPFAIIEIRANPRSYPVSANECIERLECWIVALENELATRG